MQSTLEPVGSGAQRLEPSASKFCEWSLELHVGAIMHGSCSFKAYRRLPSFLLVDLEELMWLKVLEGCTCTDGRSHCQSRGMVGPRRASSELVSLCTALQSKLGEALRVCYEM